MKRFFIILLIALIVANGKINAQGCVAIKGTAGICSRPSDAKGWELNLNNRYFKSYNILLVQKNKSREWKRAAMLSIILMN